ncbi:pentapeptide repeat-containing protein [Dactylosporangium sp. NPDC051541]|uniref:pentapeptide repeat-containing protein n=1 Tax=Dactylosporangium sp. NPDC051541 TaxID=3363977 RepID=UPI003792E609
MTVVASLKHLWPARRTVDAVVRPVKSDDEPLRPMPFWPVMAVVVGVVLAGGGLAMWLIGVWTPISASPANVANLESLRLDRIKTGLTVAAGLAAGATLLMTLRRQALSERAQRQAERAQRFAEEAQRFAEADALEQRTTALYVAAANQLASDKAAVRLAGLYALERLGQDDAKLRQTVVDVWCAYLRMPFEPPLEVLRRSVKGSPASLAADAEVLDPPKDAERRQELEVRRTAQRLLTTHLKVGSYRGPYRETSDSRYWFTGDGARLDVDLTGAVLVDCRLEGCWANQVSLSAAQFHGYADLSGAQFHGVANLIGAQFYSPANLRGAQFHGIAHLGGAQFYGSAELIGAQFYSDANLIGTRCHDDAFLGDIQFHGNAYMIEAQFDGPVDLSAARFHGSGNLSGAKFHGPAYLSEAQFHGDADLGGTEFYAYVDLRKAQFYRAVDLGGAQFYGRPNLSGVQFHGEADLNEALLEGDAIQDASATSKAQLPAGWRLSDRPAPVEGLFMVEKLGSGDQRESDVDDPTT